MYFLILLLTSIFSVISIYLLKIKDTEKQMIVFISTLLIFYFFYMVCKKFLNNRTEKKKPINNEPKENKKCMDLMKLLNCNTIDYDGNCVDSKKGINVKLDCQEPDKKEFTSDGLIPLKSYNPKDCTNDGSCIIKPDDNNIFPGFVKEKKNKACKRLKENLQKVKNQISDNCPDIKLEMDEIKKQNPKDFCKKCGKHLNLINNPTSEQFSYKNPYDISDKSNILPQVEVSKDKNICIHCRQYYEFNF